MISDNSSFTASATRIVRRSSIVSGRVFHLCPAH
jgi:hypothetical protein